MREPSVSELRESFSAASRQRSFWKGIAMVVLMVTAYGGSLTGVVLMVGAGWKLAFGVLLGLSISFLFVIGHDACHDSLTPSHTLNQWLGRLCFMPTLHPFVAWELGHNRLHHGWTNLRGVDYVYPPFTPSEFAALPAWRRGLERIYRTVPGIGLFYFIEIWWKHMLVPRQSDFEKLRARDFALDLTLVLLCLTAETVLAWASAPTPAGAALNVFCIVVLPYAIWNWLMAFVTIQHHTHPQAPWFNCLEEWSFFHGQVHGTIHVRLPRWMEIMFHNILDHTAHHVDPKIPLYHLTRAQRDLEELYPADVIVKQGSIAELYRVLKVCKLYDYVGHCWLDFDGKRSAPPVPLERWRREKKTGPEKTTEPRLTTPAQKP